MFAPLVEVLLAVSYVAGRVVSGVCGTELEADELEEDISVGCATDEVEFMP